MILNFEISNFNSTAHFSISDLSPIKIGTIKFSLTASIADCIGNNFPAFTIATGTPFLLCATSNKLCGQIISLSDSICY